MQKIIGNAKYHCTHPSRKKMLGNERNRRADAKTYLEEWVNLILKISIFRCSKNDKKHSFMEFINSPTLNAMNNSIGVARNISKNGVYTEMVWVKLGDMPKQSATKA